MKAAIRLAVRDDHDKSRRPFSRRRDSVYLPFFLFSTIGPLVLLLVHTHIEERVNTRIHEREHDLESIYNFSVSWM